MKPWKLWQRLFPFLSMLAGVLIGKSGVLRPLSNVAQMVAVTALSTVAYFLALWAFEYKFAGWRKLLVAFHPRSVMIAGFAGVLIACWRPVVTGRIQPTKEQWGFLILASAALLFLIAFFLFVREGKTVHGVVHYSEPQPSVGKHPFRAAAESSHYRGDFVLGTWDQMSEAVKDLSWPSAQKPKWVVLVSEQKLPDMLAFATFMKNPEAPVYWLHPRKLPDRRHVVFFYPETPKDYRWPDVMEPKETHG